MDKLPRHLSRGLLVATCGVLAAAYAWTRLRVVRSDHTWRGIAASCYVCEQPSVYFAHELELFELVHDGVIEYRASFECDHCELENDIALPHKVWLDLESKGSVMCEPVFQKQVNAVTFDEVHDTDIDELAKRLLGS